MKPWMVPLAALAGLAVGYLLSRHPSLDAVRVEEAVRLEKEWSAQLRARLEKTEAELAEARAAAEEPAPSTVVAPGARRPAAGTDDAVTRNELVRMLDEKNQQLNADRATLAELREKLLTAEGQAVELRAEREKMAGDLRDIQERLDAATRLSQALRSEGQSRDARLAQVEEGSREMRRKASEADQRVARLAAVSGELEELTRQRESYISDILRRYRDATDQFRAFTLRVDASTDPAFQGGTYLSRIQSAITQADEDLRQLRTLNARAARLQKQLDAQRP
ncbi:MAG: hypothetical protein R2729_08115 [Bryobacteraceae bacterium]